MGWRWLELKVISCRDIRTFNFFQKLSVYSVVSIIDEELKKKEQQQKSMQRQKTSIDKAGGRNPEWNHVLKFDIQSLPTDHVDRLFLRFDMRCEGLVHRSIGEVQVPLKDLIDEFNGAVRFVSYQVKNSDGRPNGVLNFSFKLIGKDSPKVETSPLIDGKVHCPKLEVDDIVDIHHSGDRGLYPSLDDLYDKDDQSPPPLQISSTLPNSPIHDDHQKQGLCFYGTNAVQEPPFWVLNAHEYFQFPYSSPLPLVQPSGPYWYAVESTGFDSGCAQARIN